MISPKRKLVYLAFLVLVGIGVLIFSRDLEKAFQPVNSEAEECSAKIEERIVRGSSLSPLVETGETEKILFDYYNCNEIKRNDIIAYDYSGCSNPIIKIVKGLPKDKFHLEKNSRGWNILINGEIVKNSQDKPYILSEKKSKMLALYERDYKGVIPENAFLILGNLVSGSLDSTRFGLIDKSNILGKVALD